MPARSRTGDDEPRDERRHDPVFPGFIEMAERRRALADGLAARRTEIGLSQTEVAARMGTSQSAVARLESGEADVRLSTLDRYVAALGERLDWEFERPAARARVGHTEETHADARATRMPKRDPRGKP
jgi:ribosome-binding protein aMBF1 (putative translation factor)